MTSLALKDEGNALFTQKRYCEALHQYGRALEELMKDLDDASLRCTLHTNRAACLLQLKHYSECVKVRRLSLGPTAKVWLLRDSVGHAPCISVLSFIKECSLALELDGQKVKARYRRAQAYEALDDLESALKDLRSVIHADPGNKEALVLARRVREALQKQTQSQTPVAQMLDVIANEPAAKAREDAFKGLVGMTADDLSAALELEDRGGVQVLWTCMDGKQKGQLQSPTDEVLPALQVLAACCQHPAFIERAFRQASIPTVQDLYATIAHRQDESGRDAQVATAATVLFVRLLKKWPKQISQDGYAEAARTALECWTVTLGHADPSVRELGVDAVASWVEGDDWPVHKAAPEQRRTLLLAALEGQTCDAIVSLLDGRRALSERQKAGFVLGRLFAVAARDNSNIVKSKLCSLVPWEGSRVEEEGQPAIAEAEKALLLVASLFLADAELGAWALNERKHGLTLLKLAMSTAPTAQEIAAEVINLAASGEAGRKELGPLMETNVIRMLMDSPQPSVRVAAASAYTKLGLAAKALGQRSDELSTLFNVAVEELRRAQRPTDTNGRASTDIQSTKRSTASLATERAVELLSCLVTRTSHKDEIAFGSGRCRASLPILLNKVKNGDLSASYGLAFILASLTLSNDELRKEALAEKDISSDQYDEMMKIQRMGLPKGEDGQPLQSEEDDKDPPERVQARIKELVRLDGIRALVKLAAGSVGSATQEQIAMAFVQIATVQEARGAMITQGGFNTCLELASEAHPEKTRIRALHAVAKCLVTTNPHLLSDRQRMGPIVPLLWLCNHHRASDLQHFEALLALTNLASIGDEARNSIAGNKGVQTMQQLQLCDHTMVRRAATEALCNMASHAEAIKNLRSKDKLKIWLALAEDFEDGGDVPTATAAAGALAVAAADEGVAEAIVDDEVGGVKVLRALLSSGRADLIFRSAVMAGNMSNNARAKEGLIEAGVPQLLKEVAATKLPEEVVSALHGAHAYVTDSPPPH